MNWRSRRAEAAPSYGLGSRPIVPELGYVQSDDVSFLMSDQPNPIISRDVVVVVHPSSTGTALEMNRRIIDQLGPSNVTTVSEVDSLIATGKLGSYQGMLELLGRFLEDSRQSGASIIYLLDPDVASGNVPLGVDVLPQAGDAVVVADFGSSIPVENIPDDGRQDISAFLEAVSHAQRLRVVGELGFNPYRQTAGAVTGHLDYLLGSVNGVAAKFVATPEAVFPPLGPGMVHELELNPTMRMIYGATEI